LCSEDKIPSSICPSLSASLSSPTSFRVPEKSKNCKKLPIIRRRKRVQQMRSYL